MAGTEMKASHSSEDFTVLLVQNKPKRSLTGNLKHLEKLLSAAAKLGEADLVVLPEFIFGERKSERWLTETLSFFRLFCRENSVNAVAGSIAEKETGRWYNTSFLVDRKGELIGKYRKMHLGPLEGESSEGDAVGIFSIDGVKIGVGICRDLWFPEYWRVLKKRGAVLLAVPSYIEKPRMARLSLDGQSQSS
jgi:omega-amidase